MAILSKTRKGMCRDYNRCTHKVGDGIVQTTNIVMVTKVIVVSNQRVAGSNPAGGANSRVAELKKVTSVLDGGLITLRSYPQLWVGFPPRL